MVKVVAGQRLARPGLVIFNLPQEEFLCKEFYNAGFPPVPGLRDADVIFLQNLISAFLRAAPVSMAFPVPFKSFL